MAKRRPRKMVLQRRRRRRKKMVMKKRSSQHQKLNQLPQLLLQTLNQKTGKEKVGIEITTT